VHVRELILRITRVLVDNPESVAVTESKGDQYIVLELQVEKSEIGKVIGAQGRMARAMRTILSAAAAKVRKRAMLVITEAVGSNCQARRENTETVIISGGRLIPVSARRPVDGKRRYSRLQG
jgi:predicted RNA-binding protein YlqC (UPF0109 family)